MNKVIIAVVLLAAGGLAYWKWSQGHQPAPLPTRVVPKAPPPVVPDARVEPAIQHPLGDAAVPRGKLPALDDSDALMRDGLGNLFGARHLADIFFLDGIIRRIVATIDSLPREQAPAQLWATKPASGELLVDEAGGAVTLSPRNAARYESRVRLAESIEPRRVVALYHRLYPLFQRAYEDLGYPDQYFNDRVVAVIDHLLETPISAGPITLVRPKVRYEFADPGLQARSAGQKMLLRMGPEIAERLKRVLREYRRALAR